MSVDLCWWDVSRLKSALSSRQLSVGEIIQQLLSRIASIDSGGPTIRSIIEVNRDPLDEGGSRVSHDPATPLAGIPVLLKDNIDTFDGMHTTAGSLALEASRPSRDAFVVQQLRRSGAILLGKANMSEWANFRSTHSSSGWSARGGQALNPYVLDRSPCGSSSGSASAVAAGLTPLAVGTETDGSILCPAAMCGVVGIKPTVGLTSRSGVIPISSTQDTVGPFARTVADAALLLGVLEGFDASDSASMAQDSAYHDYAQFLQRDGLKGARIGVPREVFFGYSPAADKVVEEALMAMRSAGADLIDPVEMPNVKEMREGELSVLLHEFKANLNSYLPTRVGDGPRSLEELIAFNRDHASEEMLFFGQELFLQAQETVDLNEPGYREALERDTRLSREEGLDVVLDQFQLDALVMPTTGPAFPIDPVNGDHFSGGASTPAAVAGYPAISVPAGFVRGLPVGITFMGRAFSEPTLIRLAFALEQILWAWREPKFLPTLEVSAPR